MVVDAKRGDKKTFVFRNLVPTEFSLQDPAIVRGQHQTIFESNLGRTIELIAKNIRTAARIGEGDMRIGEECSKDQDCSYRIDFELPASAGVLHKVEDGESLWTLATRYDCPMYVIWYNNPAMQDPTDVNPGQTIFIPRYYAAKGHILISRESGLLEKLEIFDQEGRLYERYVYTAVQTNVGLTDQEFEIDNPNYKF